jgi:hypothetical protein
MQKNGDIRDDSARALTLKYVARYVDHVPLEEFISSDTFGSNGLTEVNYL